MFVELISDLIFNFIYKNRKIPLPPIKNLILLESATTIATKIRTRKIKSEEVVKAYVSRIKDVNPIINAMVDPAYEVAIDRAREVDKFLKTTTKSEKELEKDTPFLGVPFSLKECFAVKGYHNSVGLVKRKNILSEKNAPVFDLLNDSGAIMLGLTNTSELCMWWETNNKVYGRTCTPYDSTRICGGSSGGEASINGAAGAAFGIGNDIGGSVRMPCFFCGIFGHKPTSGIVCNAGTIPEATGELNTFLGCGPICRYATDLMTIFKVIAKPDLHKLHLDEKVDFSKIKIYYMEGDGGNPIVSPVDPQMIEAISKIAKYFETAYGVRALKVDIREFFHSLMIWSVKMGNGGGRSFSELLGEGKGDATNVPLEFLKWCVLSSDHTLPALALAAVEKITKADQSMIDAANTKFNSLKTQFEDLLGNDGVFLYPSGPRPAPYHNQPLLHPFNYSYTAIFNILGVPVTQCPMGLSNKGVPLGVQVAANKYNDHLTIAFAVELEKAFGGWVPPCPIP
ncbi:hypothetical protein CHUAL_007483 [Chamberlinius hualienensis]